MFKIYESKTCKSYVIIEVAHPQRVWLIDINSVKEFRGSSAVLKYGEFITLESTEQRAKAYVEMCLLMED